MFKEQFIDETQPKILTTSVCKFINQEITFQDGNKYTLQSMNSLNYIDTKQSLILNEEKNYKSLIRSLPRMQERKYSLKKLLQNQVKTKKNFSSWQVNQSIFKEYQEDSKEFLDNCFEFDWNCSKIQRFIRNDTDRRKVRDLLKDNYILLKTLYKLNSQIIISEESNQNQESFGVPFQSFIKLLTQNQIIEGDLKQNDVEINLVSIKTNIGQKFTYNSDKALIRYQFIEMFFRISNDKYMRLQQTKTYSEALQRLIQQDIEPHFKNIDDPQQWRACRFWNKECDNILKLKLPFILKLFDSINDLSIQKRYIQFKWISCKEFSNFVNQIHLSSEFLNDREVVQIYNLSMQTQIDEVTQDRHQRMNLFEFMEALARISEKLSPCPIGQNLDKWTLQQRQCLPLHVKLESFLCYIYRVYKLLGVEKFEHFMKSDDPIPSIPTSTYKFKQTQFEMDNDKKEILDNIYYPQEGNKKVLSIVGVLAYIDCFKQPYVLTNYMNFFDDKFESIQSIIVSPKPKRGSKKKSPLKQMKQSKQISPVPQQEVVKLENGIHQISDQSLHEDDTLQDL